MRAATQRAAAASAARYERRRPEQTPLYRLVREHYATFAAEVDSASGGKGLPPFVKDEFDAYLECGILANGFLRLTCDTCARDTLVAFSCPPRGLPSGRKRRGICPSCGTRRMAETAAYLVEHMLPRVPVRQWVLSFPIPLCMTLARLLQRVFDIDIDHCACGGKLKLIAVIEEPAVIEKIVKHTGLDLQPTPRVPARRRVDLLE